MARIAHPASRAIRAVVLVRPAPGTAVPRTMSRRERRYAERSWRRRVPRPADAATRLSCTWSWVPLRCAGGGSLNIVHQESLGRSSPSPCHGPTRHAQGSTSAAGVVLVGLGVGDVPVVVVGALPGVVGRDVTGFGCGGLIAFCTRLRMRS